jgi:hypothetical protein
MHVTTMGICLSEVAVYQKNPETVPMYVCTLGYTSYSKNGQNEGKQKSLLQWWQGEMTDAGDFTQTGVLIQA